MSIKTLGKRIKEERATRGWTQDDVVKKSKSLTNSSLSKIESSKVKDPSISMVRDIANVFGVKVDELLEKRKQT